MRFALFYEIPVARPWGPDSERLAYQHTIEQARGRRTLRLGRLLDRRAPLPRGVLALLQPRGALRRHRRPDRADAPRLRRAAHAEAVQPPGAHGRVGRRARPHLQRPRRPRHRPLARPAPSSRASASTRPRPAACGRRRSVTSSAAGRTTTYAFEGEHWSMPPRRVQPKPIQQPHPPIWGATSSDDGHRQVGELGLGPVLVRGRRAARGGEGEDRHLPRPPSPAAPSRSASTSTTRRPPSRWRCARPPSRRRGRRRARASSGTRRPAPASSRRSPTCRPTAARSSAPTRYAADLKAVADDGSLDFMDLEYLETSGACVLGTPDQCIETCRRYEAAGVDQLLCLVNPYKIPHEQGDADDPAHGRARHPRVPLTGGRRLDRIACLNPRCSSSATATSSPSP